MTTSPLASPPALPRVLWLHTQPEHYFNCMMDDLQACGKYDFLTAFAYKGTGHYKDYPIPSKTRTLFLTPREGKGNVYPTFFEKYHKNWREDLAALKYDAVIVSGYGIKALREVIFDCKRRGIPVAMWSDSNIRSQRGRSLTDRLKRRLKTVMLSRLIRSTDLMLTANSRGIAYWRYFGTAKDRIVLCPCYSDYPRIEEARKQPRQEALGKLKIPSGHRYLFSAARLATAKGLGQMIRAFVAGGYPKQGWHYFIAGVGPLEKELKSLAGEQLEKSIHFLGFQQPRDNLLFIAHADLLILPSIYEPHGIVIQESMAAGTPVLASDVCGAAPDLITPHLNGELFKSGNEQDLSEKLADLMQNETRRSAMREEARRGFQEWFAETSPIKVVHDVVGRMLGVKN